MANFEESRGKFSGRGFDKRRSFKDRRFSGRKNIEKTKVTCSECGKECEVPFKPSSSKPVYCDSCFSKKNKSENFRVSEEDIKEIKDKLDKIIKSLKI